MAVRTMSRGVDLKTLPLARFDGGLNLRDSPSEIAPNESPDAWNVTVDARGSVGKRLGYSKGNSSGQPASLVSNGYFSQKLQRTIWQSGASLYEQTSSTSAFGATFKTFTTSARCAMVDFVGKVYIVHPVDGLFSWDGATLTAIGAGPSGTCIAVWQNCLWIGGNTTNPTRLYRSAIGDPTSWPVANTNDIREKDDAPITALAPSDRGVLVAYKEESTYRIYDSTTIAYQTLDMRYGAASSLAVVNLYGRLFSVCQFGIFSTDGSSVLSPLSERIRPLFTPGQLALANMDKWCAGKLADKVYFSLTLSGSSANNIALELSPLDGWILPHSCAASCYALYAKDDEKLLGGAPSTNGQVYDLYSGVGSDDAGAISSRYQTAWYKPSLLTLNSYHSLRLEGRGTFNLYVKLDQTLGDGELFAVDMTTSAATWDSTAKWDDGVSLWGPTYYEGVDAIYSLGAGREISFEIQESGSSSATGIPPLNSTITPVVGWWSLYAMKLLYTPYGEVA